MRRAAAFLFVFLTFLSARADALTVREIIELSRAGLGDEVLLALIEVDQRVFSVDPATLKELKAAGVSERVIVALVRSGRTPPIPGPELLPDPEPPPPQVVVVEREPAVREVAVPIAVPVYVPVITGSHKFRHAAPFNPAVPPDFPSVGSFPQHLPEPQRAAAPVYWGWGGKLRPDAWRPAPHEVPGPRRD